MIVAVLAPFVAALVYGGWAAYSNWGFGFSAAFYAAFVQGGFAFSSTWLLNQAANRLVSLYSAKSMSAMKIQLAVFVQCSFFLFSIPWILHKIVGTPEVLMAMLPGFIIGNIYLAYLVRLQIREQNKKSPY